jgi:Tol biopolymer transport system component
VPLFAYLRAVRGRCRERLLRRALVLSLLALTLGLTQVAPAAAAPPQVLATYSTDVTATSANLHAEVNPEGEATTYRFEYLTAAKYQANPPAEPFAGAAKAPTPPLPEAFLGSASTPQLASQHLGSLASATAYRYRISATNADHETSAGSTDLFITREASPSLALPDRRAWELVSPLEKNGGAIQGPGGIFGGGVIQAAAAGAAITYSSASSFGAGAQGAPPASQYVSRRGPGEAGWSTANITTPTISGSYGAEPNGVPYQLFSADLARGLLLGGVPCRGPGGGCPVANPPLPGTQAPAGYQDYYLREEEGPGFTALLSAANSELALSPEQFDLAFVGASPDLRHVVLSTCAALTPGASEVVGAEGCDPTKPNLYQWGEGQLRLINVAPGANLAAQGAAISEDGSRVYFTEAGKLWLREGPSAPRELAAGAEFQTATPDGSRAFYTKEEQLFRYDAATEVATDLTPEKGVEGVLGASADGSYVYYLSNGGLLEPPGSFGLYLDHNGAKTKVTFAADASDYPPTTGTTRLSADGARLLFLSKAALTGYDNTDATTALPDSELYLYDASAGDSLACLSCNPTNERPLGPSTIPGAIANGQAPGSTDSYKPRVLSADGRRVFFDSADSLVPSDTDARPDVYQWEAPGTGTCTGAGGCLSLISSGRGAEGAAFVDASADGSDAFFLTSQSLVGADPGSVDLYDAREAGGLPEPGLEEICNSDECAPLPIPPEDPTVGTLIPGPKNPSVHFPKPACPKGTHPARRHGKRPCVAKRHKRSGRRPARRGGGR